MKNDHNEKRISYETIAIKEIPQKNDYNETRYYAFTTKIFSLSAGNGKQDPVAVTVEKR